MPLVGAALRDLPSQGSSVFGLGINRLQLSLFAHLAADAYILNFLLRIGMCPRGPVAERVASAGKDDRTAAMPQSLVSAFQAGNQVEPPKAPP